MIYQYYCGYCACVTKQGTKRDCCSCHNCGGSARFDGEAPKKQQNLNQSFRSMVVTEDAVLYKEGK